MKYPTRKEIETEQEYEDQAVNIAKCEMLAAIAQKCPLPLALKVYAAVEAAAALADEMFNEEEVCASEYLIDVLNELIIRRMLSSGRIDINTPTQIQ